MDNHKKTVVIIGAGVAGLCTGNYAQMNGYQSQIFEKHRIPGGLVTAWKRKGYLIDLCVHWVAGSGPGFFLHKYWKEVGLLEGRKFIQYDRYGVFHARDGRTLNFFCDPDKLEKHLLELSPEDARAIHALADGVRLGIRFTPPQMEAYESGKLAWMKEVFSMLPILMDVQKWTKLTVGELAGRFQSPLIREALVTLFSPDASVFFMVLAQLGYMYNQQAGYPLGGSLPLALTLEKRYKQLGGQVQYRAPVEKILVENGRAVGVGFSDGNEVRADVTISAADGYSTIYKFLGGDFTDDKIKQRFKNWQTFQPMIFASVGVRRTFSDVPFAVEGNSFELLKPVVMAGKEYKHLPVRVHNEDTCFSPQGKTVITSAILTDYPFWEALRDDRSAYNVEKENIARAYIEALEQIWPGITAQVEMCDVATPLTFERMTGNWKASITGWKLTPGQAMAKISKTLPGLQNFWMVGQWVYPGGGLPGGVCSGREVIFNLCKQDKKSFRTNNGVA